MITLPIQQPWHVRTPILVRYLDRRYVQDFFDRGVLRLSCFVEFAKHTIVGGDGFFVKDRKYSRQAEYRFIWNVGHDVDGCLDLPCPDARQFCEPLA